MLNKYADTQMQIAWATQLLFSSIRYPSLLGRQRQHGMRSLASTSTHDSKEWEWNSNPFDLFTMPLAVIICKTIVQFKSTGTQQSRKKCLCTERFITKIIHQWGADWKKKDSFRIWLIHVIYQSLTDICIERDVNADVYSLKSPWV